MWLWLLSADEKYHRKILDNMIDELNRYKGVDTERRNNLLVKLDGVKHAMKKNQLWRDKYIRARKEFKAFRYFHGKN